MREPLTLVLSLGISPFRSCVLPNPSGLASISFYYILSSSLRNGFLMRDIKGMDPDGRGEEGKLIRIYSVRKESISNERKK